jgi:dienelactone hydrolase
MGRLSMTGKIYFFMAIIAICFSIFCGCQPHTNYLTSLKGGETGTFKFPTRNVAGFQDLMTGNNAYNAQGLGTLMLPPTASPNNKVAVMVILHGSGGEWSGRGLDQANFLVQNGIGAFIVDTFASRGLTKQDKYIRRLMKVNFPDQLTDAFAALEILHTHPFVDGNRIGVMGYSMGGATTMLAAIENIAQKSSITQNRFALHVAFYAPCIIQPENCTGTGAPIVGLWGEKDGTTPKSRCDEFIKCLQAGGNSVQAFWYPHAAHGWNGKSPMKFYKGIPKFAPCRYTIQSDGTIFEAVAAMTSSTDKEFIANSEHCVEYGYTIGRHDETYAKANQALLKAINTYMPDPK